METTLQDRLRLAIESSGMTQTAIANKIGVSSAAISMHLSGKGKPSTQTIIGLSGVLGVRREWLEYGSGPMRDQASRNSLLTSIFTDLLVNPDTDKSKFIRALATLPDECYPALVDAVLRVAAELQETQDKAQETQEESKEETQDGNKTAGE